MKKKAKAGVKRKSAKPKLPTAETVKQYVILRIDANEILDIRPNWTLAQAETWLEHNVKYLTDAVVEFSNEYIEEMTLNEYDDLDGIEDDDGD